MNQIITHIGETNIANNGIQMTVVGYRKYTDIDVHFKNGNIVKNVSYGNFKNGSINDIKRKKLNDAAEVRIGKTNIADNGMKMTIVGYRSASDIDVRFENGGLRKNVKYKHFIDGCIGNPKNARIGEVKNNKHNEQMTIIEYNKSTDITIMFDDGTIRKHMTYNNFKNGDIRKKENQDKPESKIGKIKKAKNGMIMTLLVYRASNDIDVKFEDGTIVTNKTYHNFCNGDIKNPYHEKNKHIGETKKAKNGLIMTIIEYQNSQNLTITFEDGMPVHINNYQFFKKSNVGYPKHYKNIAIKNIAYKTNDRIAFYVKCEKCGLSDVMTYEQMQAHSCCQN